MSESKIDQYKEFLNYHKKQLEYLKVPSIFWESLFHKCSESIFDAVDAFIYDNNLESEEGIEIESEYVANSKLKVYVIAENGVSPDDGTQIYLIDHAYTYTLKNITTDLLEDENVCKRVSSIMEIPNVNQQKEEIVNSISKSLWRFCQPYVYGTEISDDTWSVWYIMDELGVRIRHAQQPSFRTVPFFYAKDRVAFTLLYPIKNSNFRDEVTRNYVEGRYSDDLSYRAVMLPWSYRSFLHVDCSPAEPDINFIQSGRTKESLPEFSIDKTMLKASPEKLKVYCDYGVIKENLHHSRFILTSDEEEADVLWLSYHYKDYKELSEHPQKYVNQFPFEHILTSKDLLAVVCRRVNDCNEFLDESTLDTYPFWLPTTYNLNTELCKFISYFQQRESRSLDNYWIIKPWNRARSADMQITNDLNCIVSLPAAGPKVACKYITDPVLFPIQSVGLVKMDIRYIVILKCVKPLQLYVYNNFWLRFANKPFSLDSFDDYEKHFTVMNYNRCNLKQMFCVEFIKIFEEHYTGHKWKNIELDIFLMLKEVFRGATACPPPAGLFHNTQSRAMYGIDLMLQWDKTSDEPKIQPKLLEVNWAPDCQRACQYYPDFFDDIFEIMFLENVSNKNFTLL